MSIHRLFLVGIVGLVGAMSGSARAQCLDAWAPLEQGGFLPSQAVRALISWDPDGAGPSPEVLVAGGALGPLGNVVQWDGTSWSTVGGGTNGTVLALAVYNGELIAAGNFTMAAGIFASNIARWNGATWQSLGTGTQNGVRALTVFNGELIAGGEFVAAGGISCTRIARWNGSAWQPLGTGVGGPFPNPYVNRMAVNGGELIVSGHFTFAGGNFAGRLARWDGSSWIGGFTGLLAHAAAMEIYNGEIVIGGESLMSGPGMSYIIRGNGSNWQPLGTGIVCGVASLLVRNGVLVVGGTFSSASCSNIASWNGSSWSPIGSGIPVPNPFVTYSEVSALTDHRGGLFAGGMAFQFPGLPQYSVMASFTALGVPALSQPAGPGTGVVITNTNLIPGHEYYNVASFDLCGVQGSGPYGGLCFNDLSFLYYQLAFPVGFHPFHFIPATPTLVVGPYVGPIGSTLDALCCDVTGGVASCISGTARFTVQ